MDSLNPDPLPHRSAAPSTVVLRHELPAGDHHFDWLLLPPGVHIGTEDDRVLVTFRCPSRPDLLDPAAGTPLEVTRLPSHRARYLHYEGDLGGGRGWVRRVAAGILLDAALGDSHALLRVQWLIGATTSEPPDSSTRPSPREQSRPVHGYSLTHLAAQRWTLRAEEPTIR